MAETNTTYSEYVPTNWVNGSTPAINASNLNHIEQGIKNNSLSVLDLHSRTSSLEDGSGLPCAQPDRLGDVRVQVIDNGDGTYTGKIWTCN